MKLCTFEIRTHLGRHTRLGSVLPAGILDLNFTCAARLRSQKLADALLPDNMREFLVGESSAMAAARETVAFFEQIGIQRGLNEETLLYAPGEVKTGGALAESGVPPRLLRLRSARKKGF